MCESYVYQAILREGREEKARQIVINLLQAGASMELVVQATGLTRKNTSRDCTVRKQVNV
jgi:hypothetical protein